MAKPLSKEEKSLQEIASEKMFLQTRWKALKDEKDDEEKDAEKSYIAYRWKHLGAQEKALKSVLDSKVAKKSVSAPETFAKKFQKSKKHFKAAQALLKSLAELSTTDFKDGHRLEAYHYGRKMDDLIGGMFGPEEDEDENEVVAKGKKTLAKILLLSKDLNAYDDVDVTNPNGESKYSPGDKMQQFGDGGSLVKKGKKEFPDMGPDVDVTKPKNDPKIAKLGEDKMPFNDGHPNSTEHGHLIPGVGGKNFDVVDEANSTVHTTKPSGPSHYNAGQEGMQQFGDGGSLVAKFFNAVANAGAFLKTLAYEKAFGDSHRAMAKSLAKAMDDMDKPFAAEHSEFPGDLGNLLQEGEEDEHKKSMDDEKEDKEKEEEKEEKAMGVEPGMDGGMGDNLGLPGEEEEDPLSGLEPGMMGTNGMKSLNAMKQNSLKRAQEINELMQSVNRLSSMFHNPN